MATLVSLLVTALGVLYYICDERCNLNQCEALYIINGATVAYHQSGTPCVSSLLSQWIKKSRSEERDFLGVLNLVTLMRSAGKPKIVFYAFM